MHSKLQPNISIKQIFWQSLFERKWKGNWFSSICFTRYLLLGTRIHSILQFDVRFCIFVLFFFFCFRFTLPDSNFANSFGKLKAYAQHLLRIVCSPVSTNIMNIFTIDIWLCQIMEIGMIDWFIWELRLEIPFRNSNILYWNEIVSWKTPENVPLFVYQIPFFESIIFHSSEKYHQFNCQMQSIIYLFIIQNCISLNISELVISRY